MIVLPTIQDLTEAIILNLESEYQGEIDEDGRTILRAFAIVQAGKLKEYYLCIGLLEKNIFVDTCDEETLLRFGIIKIGRYPFPAVAAQYKITVTGSIGGLIEANTTFKSDDTALNPGILYIIDSDYTLISTTDQITVRALTAGLNGKLNISDTLTATRPIPFVNKSAIVFSEDIQPLAGETINEYRAIVIASYRLEAQGGAATDYRLWSSDAQGVKQVYPYATPNVSSQVDLYIEATIADSSDGKGTPTQSIINDVEAVVNFSPDITLPLNQRGRRPVQVIVNYKSVSIRQVDIIITGAVGFNATDISQILTALTNYVNVIRPFVSAADLSANNTINSFNIIGVIVGIKPGAIFTSITLKIDGIVLNSFQFVLGDIPFLNSVIYN